MRFTEESKVLRELRLAIGVSQGDIAKKLKCHAQFISNAERGICTIPANKLCLFFDGQELTDILEARLIDTENQFWRDSGHE